MFCRWVVGAGWLELDGVQECAVDRSRAGRAFAARTPPKATSARASIAPAARAAAAISGEWRDISILPWKSDARCVRIAANLLRRGFRAAGSGCKPVNAPVASA